MSSFPQWALDPIVGADSQVTHGLNLVLELDPAFNRLPLLLWDLALAKADVTAALEELSFVHYARFVPSWDGRALMVVTEFDGRIGPYVLDFVIALGDVFDLILGYVKDPPPLPVREHPDAFLAWVVEHDRVRLYPYNDLARLPAHFDFPVYSAYPRKTVTDIVGARARLPRPAIDHPAAEVDPADVQGNILQGYRARHARYLFFAVVNAEKARRWLAQGFVDRGSAWGGVADAAPWKVGQAPPVLTQVAFSHEGLLRLLPYARRGELETFPAAFREGAARRADANFDRGTSKPDHWLFGNDDDADHLVLFVYTREEAVGPLEEAVAALVQRADGFRHLRTMNGAAGAWPEVQEHFGFRDGVSEPRIGGRCPLGGSKFQPAASPGEFLLHDSYTSIYGGNSLGPMPAGLARNGSFGVLRLMEQNVAAFDATVRGEEKRLEVDPPKLAAMLMGRWKNGVPLALNPDHDALAGDPDLDVFDYAPSAEFPKVIDDFTGERCPVGAHIRRANPRTARVAGQRHARRLLRRGMPAAWTEGALPKVGLMGLFMNADIERQFEFIQREWLQGDQAASGIRGTTDPIAAIRSGVTEFRFLERDPKQPNLPPTEKIAMIPPLVTTRGCLYLFFPGIAALKALDAERPPVGLTFGTLVDEVGAALCDTASDAGGAVLDATGTAAQNLLGVVARLGTNAMRLATRFPELPDLPHTELSRIASDALSQWIGQPALKNLYDGRWAAFIEALIERNLASPEVERFFASFAPPPITVAPPPAAADQGKIDLSDPRFVANPHQVLRALRTQRIVWVKEQQACWVLDRAGCEDLLGRDGDFVQTQSTAAPRGVVTLDGADHRRGRAALVAAFAAACPTDKDIAGVAQKACDALTNRRHLKQFDFVRAYARPVARTVIWNFIGIDDQGQRDACDRLAHTMMLHYGRSGRPDTRDNVVFADASVRLAARLALSLADAWRYSVTPRFSHPAQATLIRTLADRTAAGVPDDERPLTFIEALVTLLQTVVASQSPHMLLGSAALHLMRPDTGGVTPWSTLQDVACALDEVRRYEPPLALIERYASGNQRICDIAVPDGCPVFAMVASANRDMPFWDKPDTFDAARAPTAPLSLGHGVHRCVAEVLQGRIATAALAPLINAMPKLRLCNPDAEPAWHPTIYFRSLQALSVSHCA